MKIKHRTESFLIHSAIWMSITIALLLFITSFFRVTPLENALAGYHAVSRFTQRIISLIVLVLSVGLHGRKRVAWLGVVVLISVSLFAHFILRHNLFGIPIILCEAYILAVLLVYHTHFSRKGRHLSVKTAVLLVSAMACIIAINAAFELSTLHAVKGKEISFYEGFSELANIILSGTTNNSSHPVFESFLLLLFWAMVVGGLLLILRSAVIKRSIMPAEKEKARELVKKYGQNPGSYLTLEDDKQLFFGKAADGVIAYGIVGDVVVVNGDPVCSPDFFDGLLTEFNLFCIEGDYQCIFLSTTALYLDKYTAHGFHHVKCGEEARFNLEELTLAGGKMAKLRANINHANKAGLVTSEYTVALEANSEIEKEIDAVSRAWMAEKKSSELAFTIGGVGLEDPMDRRYFYLRDPAGKMVAFNVYLPFSGMDGYMADVTRRLPDAPSGATEKLIYDAFTIFKQEGKHWGSMGLAPLSNIHEEGEQDSTTAKILELIYDKFNAFYGFKDLRMAKERYSPTTWEPGFFVYSTSAITPQMAYAVIKIQNPGGVLDYLKSLIK